jgi:hypothetical protein
VIIYKNDVDLLLGRMGIRHTNLIGLLGVPANERAVTIGAGRTTKKFSPGSIIKIGKINLAITVDDYITVLKTFKTLKV